MRKSSSGNNKVVHLYDHPFESSSPKVFNVENVGEWILNHYGESAKVNLQVFRGHPSASTEITSDIKAIADSSDSFYTVLQSPGTGEPITTSFLINLAVAVALSVVSSLLAPEPSLPANVNRTQASPNNALGQRENQVRYLQRVEDIYGKVKSIPSLMMQTYQKYIANEKYEYGYYCVGRGYYDITEIRDGNSDITALGTSNDNLISNIPGSSASVYGPFKSPNSGDLPDILIGSPILDKIHTVSRSVEVDGLTLKAPNQLNLPATDNYTYTPDPLGDKITQSVYKPNFNAVLSAGDTVTVSMANYTSSSVAESVSAESTGNRFVAGTSAAFSKIFPGDVVTVAGFINSNNNGTATVLTKPSPNIITVSTAGAGGLTLSDETSSDAVFSTTINYSGSYVIQIVNDGYIRLTTSTFPVEIPAFSSNVVSSTNDGYSYWVTLPFADRTQVWANIIAPTGMYKDNGGKSTTSVDFELQIEELNPSTLLPTGFVQSITSNIQGFDSTELGVTLEYATAWTGPARVRMKRLTNFDYDFNGTVIDEIKWSDLYAVSPTKRLHFGNKTTIHTLTKATQRATNVKSRQLNCQAFRKLPTYNGSTFSAILDDTGRVISGTLYPTSKVVDIIAAVSADPKIGQRDLATEVDMAQIYSVQQQLDAWDTSCGQFNYTLDSDNMSFEETVILIANAAFCTAYRQNGKIRLAFDRAQTSSTALFTHRNKKPDAETITRKFASDTEYDSVEFIYNDNISNQSETITLPLDGSGTKSKKFEIAGIRNFTQAWYRANREYYKILGQRISIETSTTLDARSLLPNSRVDIVDNTRFKSFDGEVVNQSGLELTLSQNVEFTTGTHSIILIKRDGSLDSIVCTPGSAANKVVLQNLPSEPVVTQYGEDGIRTIFSFASNDSRAAQAYLVQEIDLSDPQYPLIRCVNYSSSYYQADTATVPDRLPVINGVDSEYTDPNYYLLLDDGGYLITDDGYKFIIN